jgi:hypothetical protein
MNKTISFKLGIIGASSLILALSASAADQIAAAAELAEISTIAVQAKANLTDAASGGVLDAIAEANKRADAVDAAAAEGAAAYAALEAAMNSGDMDAADSAAEDVSAALQKAKDALNGVIPVDKNAAKREWKESLTNTGGGPGKSYDPPNIYNKPSQTQTQQDQNQDTWGNLWSGGVIGGGGFGSGSTGDRDATPE